MDASVDIRNLDIITKKWGSGPGSILFKLADTSDLMGEIGTFLNFSILKRTAEPINEDVHGVPFEPYSTSYERLREAKELPTNVDLFFTGQMLEKLTYEQTKTQVRLFFMDSPRRASDHSMKTKNVYGEGGDKLSNAEVAFYVNEIREFFGISAEERKMIVGMVEDFIADIITRKK